MTWEPYTSLDDEYADAASRAADACGYQSRAHYLRHVLQDAIAADDPEGAVEPSPRRAHDDDR